MQVNYQERAYVQSSGLRGVSELRALAVRYLLVPAVGLFGAVHLGCQYGAIPEPQVENTYRAMRAANTHVPYLCIAFAGDPSALAWVDWDGNQWRKWSLSDGSSAPRLDWATTSLGRTLRHADAWIPFGKNHVVGVLDSSLIIDGVDATVVIPMEDLLPHGCDSRIEAVIRVMEVCCLVVVTQSGVCVLVDGEGERVGLVSPVDEVVLGMAVHKSATGHSIDFVGADLCVSTSDVDWKEVGIASFSARADRRRSSSVASGSSLGPLEVPPVSGYNCQTTAIVYGKVVVGEHDLSVLANRGEAGGVIVLPGLLRDSQLEVIANSAESSILLARPLMVYFEVSESGAVRSLDRGTRCVPIMGAPQSVLQSKGSTQHIRSLENNSSLEIDDAGYKIEDEIIGAMSSARGLVVRSLRAVCWGSAEGLSFGYAMSGNTLIAPDSSNGLVIVDSGNTEIVACDFDGVERYRFSTERPVRDIGGARNGELLMLDAAGLVYSLGKNGEQRLLDCEEPAIGLLRCGRGFVSGFQTSSAVHPLGSDAIAGYTDVSLLEVATGIIGVKFADGRVHIVEQQGIEGSRECIFQASSGELCVASPSHGLVYGRLLGPKLEIRHFCGSGLLCESTIDVEPGWLQSSLRGLFCVARAADPLILAVTSREFVLLDSTSGDLLAKWAHGVPQVVVSSADSPERDAICVHCVGDRTFVLSRGGGLVEHTWGWAPTSAFQIPLLGVDRRFLFIDYPLVARFSSNAALGFNVEKALLIGSPRERYRWVGGRWTSTADSGGGTSTPLSLGWTRYL